LNKYISNDYRTEYENLCQSHGGRLLYTKGAATEKALMPMLQVSEDN